MKTNIFYLGDCLHVMEDDIPPESIDLIYLDPPFFGTGTQKGEVEWEPGRMQISYDDSKKFWSGQEIRENAPNWLKGLADKGPSSHWLPLAKYLYYMMKRLDACRRVLKSTGSIYLHCDWRASHYLKLVMDEVFGHNNFRNDIVWCYSGGGQSKKCFGKKHDIILLYSKTNHFTFNDESIRVEYTKGGGTWRAKKKGEKMYKEIDGEIHEWIPSDTGKVPEDWWSDIPIINPISKERTGYPTQKPEALLERIIKASSNEGDVVLDPMCGCGTTVVVAHRLERKWIGIDSNEKAIDVIRNRLDKMGLTQTKLGFKVEYPTFGINHKMLMQMSPKEFENWVNKRYNAQKPSVDRGVDGVTQDGVPIQTKTNRVKYDVVNQFLTDAESHPEVPKQLKKIIVVSREGFDESAWRQADWIKRNKGIKVELIDGQSLLDDNASS